eukprot:COSAG02_NODE_843_length_16599_cov_6.528485_3_plen_62_part_00
MKIKFTATATVMPVPAVAQIAAAARGAYRCLRQVRRNLFAQVHRPNVQPLANNFRTQRNTV